jgi:predicted transcriptional regulator
MKIKDVQEILKAELLCGDSCVDNDVEGYFACDLISEMLLHMKPSSLLVTSLLNAHVVHTAHVMDVSGVVFVAGKKPDETIIANARQNAIPLLSTSYLMYESCGKLYVSGIGISLENTDPVSGD